MSVYNNNNMSADYYLVPGSLPSSAKMHILTNGLANIGSTDSALVTNAASTLSLSVNGKVNSGGNIGGSVGVIAAPYYSLNPTGGTSGTAIIIPNGTTAQRPPLAYSLPGYLRYNIDSSYSTLEYYRQSQTVYLQLYSPPNVTSITPTSVTLNAIVQPTITISGSNFDTTYPMTVIFYTNNFIASYIAPNIITNSTTLMTVTLPTGVYNGSSAVANSPYTIRVISEYTGMGYTFFNALTVVTGSFVSIAPSRLNTVYTSRSYSQSSFFLGTYGSTANTYGPPPQIVVTYAGNPVTNYKFNPVSPGYSLVNGTGLTIDASGFITGTIKNGYVATSQTVTVGVIAGSNSSYDASLNTDLQITFAPLLLNFTGSGAVITPVNTYTYAYFQYANNNTFAVPPTPSSQLAQYSPPNMPPPATAASHSLTFSTSILGTNIISADPSYSYLDFLIIAGGGGGGSGYQGGGGGAGGMVSSGLNSNYTYNYNIGGSGGRLDGLGMGPYQVPQGLVDSASISIIVGGGGPGGYYNSTGGAGNPNNRSGSGGNSSITFPTSNVGTITYTAFGGGAGAGEQNISTNAGYMTGVNYQPLPGGSGGGSSHGMKMAYTNYSANSIQLTNSTYNGSTYILTVGGLTLSTATGGTTTIGPFLAVYNSTLTTPPLSSLIGFIAPYNTNGTTGTGGAGTYYLTGRTVPSGGTSYADALASSTSISSPSTFTVPGGLSGGSTGDTTQNLIYTGLVTGTTYVGNYSLGFSNSSFYGGLIDTLTSYQGNNGGYGVTNSPYVGGGGGGAGLAGGFANTAGGAGVGGDGLENFIKTVNYNNTTPSAGSGTVYAGGGGGSARSATGGPWAGGTGGGGRGVNTWSGSNLAGNGTAGLGGGGGSAGGSNGAGTTGQYGGSGGSGTVIIRYRVA